MRPLRTLAALVLFGAALEAQMSPVVISNYQTGTDGGYLSYVGTGITSPSLVLYPKLPFRGGNNCAVMAVTSHSAYTQGTPTDNEGETWVAGPSTTDTGDNYTLKIWYVLGDTAGTNKITIPMTGTPSSSPSSRVGAWVTEVENCSTSTIGGNGSLQTAATGSALTLTLSSAPSSGDMVWAAWLDTGFDVNNDSPTPFVSSISAGSGFTLLSKSLSFGKMAEYNTSTTSASVQATFSGTDTILGVAIVIKQGSAGTGPPSAAYIDHYQVEQFNSSTQQIYFPCSGNLIVGMQSTSANVTSVSGSTGTWETPSTINLTTVPLGQIFYAYGATCASTTNFTPAWSSTPAYPGSVGEFASVTNAINTSSVFDTGSLTTSGNQLSAADLSANTITPSSMNEMIFNITPVNLHTLTGVVADSYGHTPAFLAAVNTRDDDTGSDCSGSTQPSTLDEDNGYAVFVNTSDTNPVTFIYTGTQVTGNCTTNPAGVGGYQSVSAAFKMVGAVDPPDPPTNVTATPH